MLPTFQGRVKGDSVDVHDLSIPLSGGKFHRCALVPIFLQAIKGMGICDALRADCIRAVDPIDPTPAWVEERPVGQAPRRFTAAPAGEERLGGLHLAVRLFTENRDSLAACLVRCTAPLSLLGVVALLPGHDLSIPLSETIFHSHVGSQRSFSRSLASWESAQISVTYEKI